MNRPNGHLPEQATLSNEHTASRIATMVTLRTMNFSLFLVLWTVLLGLSDAQPGDVLSVQQEMDTLLSFKSSLLQRNPSTILSSWVSNDSTPCKWEGIKCSNSSSHVAELDLSNKRLAGPIPSGILSRITGLSYLSLASNNLNGSIPLDIGNCTNLAFLDLSNNTLSGSIPPNIGTGLVNVQFFNLSSNNLTGGIPEELFADCKALQRLNLSSNPLGGAIPWSLNRCSQLRSLSLEGNLLVGEIPTALGQLQMLQDLNLGNNQLVGFIPGALFIPCRSLQSIDLSLNNLTGAIPREIGNCSRLLNLTLSQNQLDTIPQEIGLLRELSCIVVGRNNFSSLPNSLRNCSKLSVLILNENSFSGAIPSFLDELRSLRFMVLHTNSFTGDIPEWLVSNHSDLLHLDLSDNMLSGRIPSGLGFFKSLKFLLLANNRFVGSIPETLGDISELQFLDLSGNQLTGSIPRTLGKLQKMLWLMLANNTLSGEIPRDLSNCSSLLWLNAAYNILSGDLSAELEFMGRSVQATFDDNLRNLPIVPKEIGECAVLRRWLPSNFPPFSLVEKVLNRDRCQVFWNLLLRGKFMYSVCSSIPTEESMGYIQLSGNNLSGSIPASFGRIHRLSLLFLYENNLSGIIPPELSNLKLTGLNLSDNALTGPIPDSFGEMKCLQSLDLSKNNLSGSIPNTLLALTSLAKFNISHNPLMSGAIPFSQQFSTFDEDSYIGDYQLCYVRAETGTMQPSTKIPFCGQRKNLTAGSSSAGGSSARSNPLHFSTILGISLACALGVIVMGLASMCLASRPPSSQSSSFVMVTKDSPSKFSVERFQGDPSVSLFTMDLPKQLTYNHLVQATGSFDESSVIGCGGFGIVYKAMLQDGSTVAIKKLIREGPAADREFLAEMDTLGHILHENLVPLLGYSSYASQKLLVYKYMENGSLDDWLHERPRSGSDALDWPVRLDVAIGTARGLRFLHQGCSPPIIHRDMKASNILLDAEFRPRLTDFGLARVLGAQEETHVSTVLAGTLGYVPPEYCQTWRATVKGDVYSFGVVLLELISGRRPMMEAGNHNSSSASCSENDNGCSNLVEWSIQCLQHGTLSQLYDPVVAKTASEDDLFKFLRLALDCTQEIPVRRPCMWDVLTRLEDIKAGAHT